MELDLEAAPARPRDPDATRGDPDEITSEIPDSGPTDPSRDLTLGIPKHKTAHYLNLKRKDGTTL